MRVLICGDRNWSDRGAIMDYIETLPSDTVIIHGGAKGADRMAGEYAPGEVIVYPAQWSTYGGAAGPIRNTQMLTEGNPDIVVYFHDNLHLSKGTKNMVDQAQKAGIPTINGSKVKPVEVEKEGKYGR